MVNSTIILNTFYSLICSIWTTCSTCYKWPLLHYWFLSSYSFCKGRHSMKSYSSLRLLPALVHSCHGNWDCILHVCDPNNFHQCTCLLHSDPGVVIDGDHVVFQVVVVRCSYCPGDSQDSHCHCAQQCRDCSICRDLRNFCILKLK